MRNKDTIRVYLRSKWFRLGSSIILAFILASIALLIPVTRGTTIHVSVPTLPDDETIDLTLPFGAEIVHATGGLTITKFASPSPDVNHGELLTYTLIISNNTGQELTDVVVTDTVPTNTQCIGSSMDASTNDWTVNPALCESSGIARWGLVRLFGDSLPQGASAALTYVVTLDEPLVDQSLIENIKYGVTAENLADTQTFNDIGIDPVNTIVNAPNWQITKSVNPTPTVQPGASLVYTLDIVNDGHLTTTGTYTVTDEVPANTTFDSASSPGVFNAGDVTWAFNTPLGLNQGFSVVFTVTVTDPLTDEIPIVNQTYHIIGGNVFSQADGTPITVTVDAPVTITLTKVDDPDPVPAGDLLTYTITVNNDASSKGPASDVVITDTIPANTTLVDAGFVGGLSGIVVTSPLTVTWQLTDPIPVGGSASVTMTVRVATPLPTGTIISNLYEVGVSNDATITTDPPVVTTTVVSTPTFNLTKADDPSTVEAGDTLTYTITFSNSGNSDATNTVVTDTLDSRVSYIASTPPGTHDGSPFGGVITWNIGLLAGDGVGSGVLTVTVAVSSPLPNNSLIPNTVEIGSSEGVTESTTITTVVNSRPILDITKTVVPTPTVQAGALLTYTLTISNVGNANATQLVLSDTIPTSTTFDSATAGFNPPLPTPGNPITWSIGLLEVGVPQVFTFVVNVDTPLPNGTLITNRASISSALDFDLSNLVTTTVESTPTLEISKEGQPEPVSAGGLLTYTIRYTNTGNADATNVLISDTFPLNTNYANDTSSPDVSPGSLTADGIEWTVGTVAGNGGSGVITLTVNVESPQDAGTLLINQVRIEADEPSVAVDIFTNTITSTPILEIAKLESAEPAKAGTDLVYTIVYTNVGNMDATGVVITDTYEGDFTSITASPPGVVFPAPPPARIVWNIGTVPANSLPQTQLVTVTLPASLTEGTVLTNSVIINSDQAVTDNHTITTTVKALEADLTIVKMRVGSGEVVIGNPIIYTLTITNNGPDTVTAVVTDTFTNAEFGSIAIAPPYSGSPCTTPPAGPLVCTISGFTGTTIITVTLNTTNSISGTVSNTGEILPTNGAEESDPSDNTSTPPDVIVRDPEADLRVDKIRIGSGVVVIGQPITYSLTVQNNGPGDPVTAILTDTFTNASYKSHTIAPALPGISCTPGAGQLVCTIPNFSSGPVIITLVLDTSSSVPGVVTNDAEVGSTGTVVELDPSDNTDSAPDVTVRAPEADLQISKTRAGSGVVVIDAPITYTLAITNGGPDTVTAVVTDSFTNASVGSITIDPPYSGSPCTSGPTQFVCTISGFTNSTRITVVLDTTNSVSGTVANGAEIGAQNSIVVETNPGDNADTAPDVTVRLPIADLQINKSASPTQVVDGSFITYTIVVTNVGSDTVDVAVTDTFSASAASFVSCSPSCSGTGPVTWSLDDFTGSQTLSLVLRAAFGFTGTFTNTAAINFANVIGIDNNPNNNSSDAGVKVIFVPKLLYLPIILKNFSPATPTPTPTSTSTPPPPGTGTPTPTSTPPPPGTGTPTPTSTPTPLPIDLIITSFSINPPNPTSSDNVVVTIVIQNQGTGSTGEGFWTDFYVNPTTLPNTPSLGRDRRWSNPAVGSSQGIAWPIPALGPGQSVTLTSDGSVGLAPDPEQTVWNGQLNAGNFNLYSFVDSFDANDPTGPTNVEIVETNENNNMAGPINIIIAASADETDPSSAPDPIPLSPRPDLGQ